MKKANSTSKFELFDKGVCVCDKGGCVCDCFAVYDCLPLHKMRLNECIRFHNRFKALLSITELAMRRCVLGKET